MITVDQFKRFAPLVGARRPAAYDELTEAINKTFQRFDINTPRRGRYFLAQAYFETTGFTKFSEDLYYQTPQRLVVVWPKRFTLDANDKTKAFAPDYVKNEEKLSNFIYANQYGNGDIASGDGFKYRGRGGFHLTFLDNYKACSQDLYKDNRLVDKPDLALEYEDGMMIAGWFWNKRKLNELADKDEFTKVTGKINGSEATAPARLPVLNKANQIFSFT